MTQAQILGFSCALYLVGMFIPAEKRLLFLLICVSAWLSHGLGLALSVYAPEGLYIGFATFWAAAIWIAVVVFIVENRHFTLEGLRYMVLPQAALTCIILSLFQGNLVILSGKPPMYPWHIGVAMLAYGTLTIAAFHTLLMTAQEYSLHTSKGKKAPDWMVKVLNQLPALLKMEKILFTLIALGFIFLTATVVSGIIFSEQVLGVPVKWNHKTVLAVFSWILFGALLVGRHWKGWRGKTVLRTTLFAFTTLLLAYVGSRFVLEVILHKGIA